MSADTTVVDAPIGPIGPVADAIASGALGDRLWFYANYHCNLVCTYCLTESAPNVSRRMVEPSTMVELATQARSLGFRALGVTGGEPFMIASMPDTIEALSDVLPIVVLSNATLFTGTRLERVSGFAGRPIHVQVSLDAPDAAPNDLLRGDDNWSSVATAIPRLVERGVKVRIATTVDGDGLDPADHDRLCALHRSWGVPDEDHIVRPVVRRGRAAANDMGVTAGIADLPAELCVTADGAFWGPFGPTVRDGRVDTDLLITRTTMPLSVPAEAMVRIAGGRPAGTDAALGIR